MFCTRNIVRYYFRLYILKWRFQISEAKCFIPGKETVNDLFGSLQEMKIPQVESDIDLEVVNSFYGFKVVFFMFR
jgi:hypothetical protein